MIVRNVFAYTVLLVLLTTVIFIFIDDFTFTLKPVENEFKKKENNYNLPKALGIAFAITFIFILIKEGTFESSNNNLSNNNIVKKITMNNNKNSYSINNNINRIFKSLK